MQFKKAITAGAIGAIMVGSTVAFAAASVPSNYPSPFVSGSSSDVYVVIGDSPYGSEGLSARLSDLAGAVDIAARFGAAPVTTQTVSSSTGPVLAVTGGDGKQVSAAGADVNYNDELDDVDATYGSNDLRTLLADGTYMESKGDTTNNVGYTQKITLQTGTGSVIYGKNTESDSETVATYVKLDSNENAFSYKVSFTTDAAYSATAANINDDFKNSKLKILGKTFTVSEVRNTAGVVDGITLLTGAFTATQGEYVTKTYTAAETGLDKDFTVEVVIVSDSSLEVKLKINGETTDALTAGQTYRLSDGTEIGIDDVLPNEGAESTGADIVTFYIGARKILLDNGDPVKLNEQELTAWDTTVTITAAATTLSSIQIDYAPDDNLFIGKGESVTEPVFSAFEIKNVDVERNDEEIKVTAGADKATIKFYNNDGRLVEIPVVYKNGADVVLGSSYDYHDNTRATIGTANAAYEEQGLMFGDGDFCDGLATIADCENSYILVTSAGGEIRVFKLTDTDAAGNKYDVKDLTTGKEYQDLDFGVAEDVDIISDFTLTETDVNTITATNIDSYGAATTLTFKTKNDGLMQITPTATAAAANLTITITDADGLSTSGFDLEANSDADDVEIDTGAANDILGSLVPVSKDSDTYVGLDDTAAGSTFGTMFTYDNENKDDITIKYPEDKAIVDVFVIQKGATVTSSGSGSCTSTTPAPIKASSVGSVGKIASAISTSAPGKNLILVGGPCANSLVKDLIQKQLNSQETDCVVLWNEFRGSDTQVIKLIDNAWGSGKAALIVAGTTSADTRAVTNMLASY